MFYFTDNLLLHVIVRSRTQAIEFFSHKVEKIFRRRVLPLPVTSHESDGLYLGSRFIHTFKDMKCVSRAAWNWNCMCIARKTTPENWIQHQRWSCRSLALLLRDYEMRGALTGIGLKCDWKCIKKEHPFKFCRWPKNSGLFYTIRYSTEAGYLLKLKLIYDRQSVGQSVLVSGAHLGPVTNCSFSLKFPLDSCGFVIL
jgi:hypothetical protein